METVGALSSNVFDTVRPENIKTTVDYGNTHYGGYIQQCVSSIQSKKQVQDVIQP